MVAGLVAANISWKLRYRKKAQSQVEEERDNHLSNIIMAGLVSLLSQSVYFWW